jgi:hypothetical protein
MAYHSSAESEESTLPLASGLNQSSTARSNPTQQQSCSVEWLMDLYRQLLSSPTSESLRQQFYQASTSCTEDSLARTLALQGAEEVWRESEAGYFLKSCALSMVLSPDGYSWRTCQQSLLEEACKSPQRLPAGGMIVDGKLYPLRKSEQSTLENGGGYWPTPSATEGGPIPPDTDYRPNRRSYNKRTGKHVQITLRRFVQMWPTPTARNAPDCPAERQRKSPSLESIVGGQLNPTWVEWLMGYSTGWTELNALVMQWSRNVRKKRLKD